MYRMQDIAPPIDPRQKPARRWLIITQLIAASFLAPWFCIASFASMIAWPDPIGAQGGWTLLTLSFAAMLYYPIIAIIPITIAWFLYTRKQYRWATLLTFIPILYFGVAVLLWLVTGGASTV
jgi:hypothetical protein